MKNIYLVQPNYKGGSGKYSSYWIPYSVGSLWAYSSLNEKIRANYALKGFLFRREPIVEVVKKLEQPDIIGFSNYIWNSNYNRFLAQEIKNEWPDTTIVFGGPEVPDNIESFFSDNPYVDIAVHQEAEHTFETILLDYLDGDLDPSNIAGVSYLDQNNVAVKNPSNGRIQDLDELPSPYLTGVFDKLLADNQAQWAATYETNRGCPFKCHFCDWGSLTFSKIKKFSIERVIQELEWFSDHQIEYIFVADANFGAFKKRDFGIAEQLVRVSNQTGYPKNVNIQWAKNSNQDIVELASKMGAVHKGMTLSVQSMSENVLEAIERQNMAISNLSEILRRCNEKGIPSYTELILGLPLETFESWQDGWHKLLDMGQHCSVDLWIAQTLVNSELNQEAERKKYGLKTIKAKDYFFGISESASSIENEISEEIPLIRETNTLPFDDLIEAYMYGWMMINFHLFGWTQLCARFLHRYSNMLYGEFYRRLFIFTRTHRKSNIIFSQYEITKERIIEYLTKGAIEVNLQNEIGIDLKFVGHNLMHSSQMVFRYNNLETITELEPFLDSITQNIPSQLQADLLRAQERWLVFHNRKYPQRVQLNSNIYDYVLKASDLEYGEHTYELDYVAEIREFIPNIKPNMKELDLKEFLRMFWLKRRWGPGTATATLVKSDEA